MSTNKNWCCAKCYYFTSTNQFQFKRIEIKKPQPCSSSAIFYYNVSLYQSRSVY